MKKAIIITYFLCLAFFAASGPSGFEDKLHYALLPWCVVGCVIVASQRYPKLNAHILWASFCAVSLTRMYRAYEQERWSAEVYRSQRAQAGIKKVPNQSPDPTPPSGAGHL